MADRKLIVDKMRCQGFARCLDVAPTLFELDDQQIAVIVRQPSDDGEWTAAKEAAKVCPRYAIRQE